MTSKTSRSLMARVSNELYNKILFLALKAGETISEFVANELQKNVHAPVIDKNLVAQQREYSLCKRDAEYFITNYCKIIKPISTEPNAFCLYDWQRSAIKSFLNNNFSVIVKSRQIGMSTLFVAYSLWFALFHDNQRVMIVAHNLSSMKILYKILRQMKFEVPSFLFNENDKTSELQCSFKNGSSIEITSYKIDATHGYSVDLLILDEAAWMMNLDALLPCAIGGKAIVSSTYNDNVSQKFDEDDIKLRCKTGEKKTGDDFRALLSTHSNVIVLPYTVCPKMTNDVIENIKKTMSTKLFLQQFLCDYSSDVQRGTNVKQN